MIVLTLYSRTDCHLCDEMLAELTPLIEGRARVEIVDIDGDETLRLRFGTSIPVLMHRDEELARYRLDRSRIRRFLDRAD